jgi:hypothetical protein
MEHELQSKTSEKKSVEHELALYKKKATDFAKKLKTIEESYLSEAKMAKSEQRRKEHEWSE